MRLFSEPSPDHEGEDKTPHQQKKDKNALQEIVIISPRKEILSEITSQLLMHNLKKIIKFDEDFLALLNDNITSRATVVIIDIVDSDNIKLINEKIVHLIPTMAFTIIVGDNDSIVFAQTLMFSGNLHYIHTGSQLAQIPGLLLSQHNSLAYRNTIKISVVGCKGGSGTSIVAHKLFQYAGLLTSLPILLVQGASSSSDVDLLMAHALPRDGSLLQVSKNQSVYIEPSDSAWNYNDARFNRFNLVFIDQMLHTQSLEYMDLVLSKSHTVILIVTRELPTLRVAKKVLDENKRIMQSRPDRTTRILVCLNENHPCHESELRDSDIESYLGCEIAVINPYNVKNTTLATSSSLYHFVAKLLGKPVKNRSPKIFQSLLFMLRR